MSGYSLFSYQFKKTFHDFFIDEILREVEKHFAIRCNQRPPVLFFLNVYNFSIKYNSFLQMFLRVFFESILVTAEKVSHFESGTIFGMQSL